MVQWSRSNRPALLVLPALGLLAATVSSRAPTAEEVRGGAEITASEIRQHVEALASPKMEGREAGTAGEKEAAAYIAREFARAGLRFPESFPDYRQAFPIRTNLRLGPKNALTLSLPDKKIDLEPTEDYVPFSFSRAGEFSGEVVFAGYGISAPELEYDDYTAVDAGGKVVLVLRHEPEEKDPQSRFAGESFTSHATFRRKAENAREHGAVALVVVTDPLHHAEDPDELVPLDSTESLEEQGILPVFHLKRSVTEEIFSAFGGSLLAEQQRIDQSLHWQSQLAGPSSFQFPPGQVLARGSVELASDMSEAWNLVGIWPGSHPDRNQQAIVIGAHYDHLGRGGAGSLAPRLRGTIHAGADDNASGVAGLLELAEVFSQGKEAVDRTLVFVAFSGEEKGLLGSAHYVRNPVWPLDRTVTMINMDMIGRMQKNIVHIGGAGTARGFEEMLRRGNEPLGLDLRLSASGFGPSDHTSFYAKKMPVLFFFTGAHTDYHKPSDTAEKIEAESAARLVRYVEWLARELARQEAPPEYVAVAAPAGEGHGAGRARAYLGIIPEYGQDGSGLRIQGVQPDSPAEKGGLEDGDRIVRFADRVIDNIYDLTEALASAQPGQEVAVIVRRGEEEVSLRLTLGKRGR